MGAIIAALAALIIDEDNSKSYSSHRSKYDDEGLGWFLVIMIIVIILSAFILSR